MRIALLYPPPWKIPAPGQDLRVFGNEGPPADFSDGDISQTTFIIEYELQKWLRLRTNILQGSSAQTQLFQRMQGSGADLLFFFRY